MATRKKSTKKTSRKKTVASEIPVLTRRAANKSTASAGENIVLVENFDLNTEYAQEIRALVTVAVNDCVPHIIDTIMDKLIQTGSSEKPKTPRSK